VIAVCGGAVAGSETAAACAERGAYVVVFDQNKRPYGKIEDGLPRWHVKLRQKEYRAIDENLKKPGVYFVPSTRLGRDVSYDEIRSWGFSAVIMANGAWRDRPLPVPEAERFLGRGLAYQNPFVYWFNHYQEPGYEGPRFAVPDGTVVIGGGLASIDVVKIVNFELYGRALRERGFETDVEEMETRGIPLVCEKHGVRPEELGIRGVTLYYRRRKEDMPLASMDNPTEDQLAKLKTARAKIMDRVIRKYLVNFEELMSPVELLGTDELSGVRFRRNEMVEGRPRAVAGSEVDIETALVISSIGSIPEPIEGVPMEGELYRWRDQTTGELADGVYGLGNVLTGKGNIKESRQSAHSVVGNLIAGYLGVAGSDHTSEMRDHLHSQERHDMDETAAKAVDEGRNLPPEKIRAIFERVQRRWETIGYDGDYQRWIEAHTPEGFV
jgi:NADPH-dependent glutamate synthase beta subunit-like oxidoreductase